MDPLVSCVCTSIPSRFPLLQRAILSFTKQQYSRRELIIAVADEVYFQAIKTFLVAHEFTHDIKVFFRPGIRTAVDGYIAALLQAKGDMIAFVQDDDVHHAAWLIDGVNGMNNASASAPQIAFYYFHESGELFVADFTKFEGRMSETVVVNSLVVQRDALPPMNFQPSNFLAQLTDSLHRYGASLFPYARGNTVVGVYGDNLRGSDVLRESVSKAAKTWHVSQLNAAKDELVKSLNEYYWNVDSIDVAGPDGVAFEFKPENRFSSDNYLPIAVKPTVEQVTENVEEKT